jgi:hypothetical protein
MYSVTDFENLVVTYATKKNVFKGRGEDMARDPDMTGKRPLTSASAASQHSEASGIQYDLMHLCLNYG